jgi:hypothetical protein
MNRNPGKILAILALAAVVAGGNVIYQRYDTNLHELSRASSDWPAVRGLVTVSNLEFRRNNAGAANGTEFDVDVTYEYAVDERVYRNDVVRFDQDELTNDRKELLVSAYPVGRRVDVFYDPDDPDRSVLVRGSYGDGQ